MVSALLGRTLRMALTLLGSAHAYQTIAPAALKQAASGSEDPQVGQSAHGRHRRPHKRSVAHTAEQEAAQGVTIKYLSAFHKSERRKTRPNDWEEGPWVPDMWEPSAADDAAVSYTHLTLPTKA